jgi:MPBQ/MSBQ methyltransferase
MKQVMSVPPYFDYLIEAFHRSEVGRSVHLGYWRKPDSPNESFTAAQQALDTFILDKAGLVSSMKMLDVGCGFGGTIAAVDSRISDAHLIGINIDERQLAICRTLESQNRNSIEWQQADACDMPFDEQSFERIFCIEAMFHFTSRRRFFHGAARLLKPGGRLVITDLVIAPELHKVALSGDLPGFTIEAALADGYGPWPDFWSGDADHQSIATDVGLRCSEYGDITCETQPSYRYTVSSGMDDMHDPGNHSLRAAMTLRWLHQQGLIRYVWGVFEKDI